MKATKLFPILFLLCLVLLSLLSESVLFCETQTARPHEYLAKAVYIEKITVFVKWPEQCDIQNKSTPFVLGMIGNSDIKSYFEEIYCVQKKKIKHKNVTLKHFTSPDSIKNCHLLFISKERERDLPQILSHLKGKPILTIGDAEGLAKKGVHINLYKKGNRIRYEINPVEIQRSTLCVSYRLLKWGDIVTPLPKRERRPPTLLHGPGD